MPNWKQMFAMLGFAVTFALASGIIVKCLANDVRIVKKELGFDKEKSSDK